MPLNICNGSYAQLLQCFFANNSESTWNPWSPCLVPLFASWIFWCFIQFEVTWPSFVDAALEACTVNWPRQTQRSSRVASSSSLTCQWTCPQTQGPKPAKKQPRAHCQRTKWVKTGQATSSILLLQTFISWTVHWAGQSGAKMRTWQIMKTPSDIRHKKKHRNLSARLSLKKLYATIFDRNALNIL